jgi:hypothetical protein
MSSAELETCRQAKTVAIAVLLSAMLVLFLTVVCMSMSNSSYVSRLRDLRAMLRLRERQLAEARRRLELLGEQPVRSTPSLPSYSRAVSLSGLVLPSYEQSEASRGVSEALL